MKYWKLWLNLAQACSEFDRTHCILSVVACVTKISQHCRTKARFFTTRVDGPSWRAVNSASAGLAYISDLLTQVVNGKHNTWERRAVIDTAVVAACVEVVPVDGDERWSSASWNRSTCVRHRWSKRHQSMRAHLYYKHSKLIDAFQKVTRRICIRGLCLELLTYYVLFVQSLVSTLHLTPKPPWKNSPYTRGFLVKIKLF